MFRDSSKKNAVDSYKASLLKTLEAKMNYKMLLQYLQAPPEIYIANLCREAYALDPSSEKYKKQLQNLAKELVNIISDDLERLEWRLVADIELMNIQLLIPSIIKNEEDYFNKLKQKYQGYENYLEGMKYLNGWCNTHVNVDKATTFFSENQSPLFHLGVARCHLAKIKDIPTFEKAFKEINSILKTVKHSNDPFIQFQARQIESQFNQISLHPKFVTFTQNPYFFKFKELATSTIPRVQRTLFCAAAAILYHSTDKKDEQTNDNKITCRIYIDTKANVETPGKEKHKALAAELNRVIEYALKHPSDEASQFPLRYIQKAMEKTSQPDAKKAWTDSMKQTDFLAFFNYHQEQPEPKVETKPFISRFMANKGA